MVAIEELEKFNPWWRTGQVKEDWLKEYRRRLYYELESHLERRQAQLIWGLRRTGKSTLLFQLIQKLLSLKIEPKRIFYFSFDEIAFELKDVLETYQKIALNRTFDEAGGKIYLFLDEVQKINDWESKIKVYYDLYPNVKLFLSGSASVRLRKGSKESLAGRVMDFLLKPLSFGEFLEMNGKDLKNIREVPDIWKREIIPLFYRYLKYGMFPELINEQDEEFAKKYLLNNVMDRVIYKDLPEEFEIKDVELLKSLVYLVGKNPGMIVNYGEISKNLGRDQRTIANYFEYLEFGLLVRFAFNYRGSPLASMRKMKKAYLATPNFAFAFSQGLERLLPYLLENLILTETDAEFFYRDGFEVDFILVDEEKGKLVPIEVKKEWKDAGQIKKFIGKFGERVEKPMIVDLESEGQTDGIEIIPAWKFLLLEPYKQAGEA